MLSEWFHGLLGGLMIGTAAAIYLFVSGRIIGALGTVGAVVDGSATRDWTERLAFVAGLVGVRPLKVRFTTHPSLGI